MNPRVPTIPRKTAFFTNGKGAPMDVADSSRWFHGSPSMLRILAAGSAITRNRRLAEAFSHKPSLLAFSNDGTIKHNGTMDGYLYQIDEPISQEDAQIHPGIVQSDAWEWTTKRDLKLKLLQRTKLQPAERLGILKATLMRTGTRLAVFFRRRWSPTSKPANNPPPRDGHQERRSS